MVYSSALVTGASSGIGRALCLELARRGTPVAAMARRAELLDELKAEIEAAGGRCLPVAGDVARSEDIARAVAQAEEAFGPLELVVANAGVGQSGLAETLPPGMARRTFEVNAIGAVETVEAALPGMLERGKGQLAIVSSLGSWRGLPTAAAYTASKAAANAYCEALGAEVRRRGVAVSCVCPGFVDTPMIDLAKKRTMFVWDAGRAARHIADGLERRRRWIVFPLATRLGMIAVRLVPAPLLEWIVEKVILKPLLRP